jgi:hypothetical protein
LKLNLRDKLDEIPDSEIDSTVYKYLIDKRMLLSYKLILLENFYSLYDKYNVNETIMRIDDVEMEIPRFLLCLRLSSHSQEENVSIDSVMRTKRYLDENVIDKGEECNNDFSNGIIEEEDQNEEEEDEEEEEEEEEKEV